MTCENILKDYTADCTERMMRSEFSELGRIADVLLEAKKRGSVVYTAGNGGSLATASHICNDLTKGCRVNGHPGFSTMCLGDSSAILTCLGNDFSYDDVYSIQVETKFKPGDVFMVFSGSGNSENVVRAVKLANEMGAVTIGFLGRDGGKLLPLCKYSIIAPTDNMEQIEDMHMLYCHALSYTIQTVLAEEP